MTRTSPYRQRHGGDIVLSLAVDRDFKSQSGEKETDFIDIVAWRSTAEFVSKYFHQGPYGCGGGPTANPGLDRQGRRQRRSAEVVADNVYFGDSKRDGGDSAGYNAGYSPAPASRSAAPSSFSAGGSDFAEIGEDDGELPF